MKRKYYILLLLLLSVDCWYLKPFGNFFASNLGFTAYLCALFVGMVYYYHKNKYPTLLLKPKYYKPIIWIFIAVLLSFIPAYINYGQSFARSIIASRVMLIYLTLPVMLIVRPTVKDIRWSVYCFSLLYVITVLFDSILGIPIIEQIEGITYKKGVDYIDENDYIHTLEGVHFIGIAFIFALNILRTIFSLRNLIITFLLIGLIFLIHNRSTLFPCSLLMLLVLFPARKRKNKYSIVISCILLVIIFVLLYHTTTEWKILFEETGEQLNDKDYNRNLALYYFLFDACPHWWEYILGNGFLSAKATTHMQDMMENGVFNSDLGFIGLWNQYGVIPVILFFAILFKIMFNKKYGFVIKSNAFLILFCSMTTAYFAQDSKIPWACVFLYMYSLETYAKGELYIKKKRNIIRDSVYATTK